MATKKKSTTSTTRTTQNPLPWLLGGILLILAYGLYQDGYRIQKIDATQVCTICQATVTPTPEVPLIDQLGPEQHFPGKVNGPAIAEIWDGAQYCALVEVHERETLNWNNPGAYWVAASEDVLGKRFPAHKQEYAKNYPNCSVLKSANDVPNPTK